MTTRALPIAVLFSILALLPALAPPVAAAPLPQAPGAADETPAEAEAREPPIVLYMTTWCPYCRKARKLLDEIGADYVEKDIEKDAEALREFQVKGKGSSSIPLIDFDGEILRGYQEEKIRKLAAEVAARS